MIIWKVSLSLAVWVIWVLFVRFLGRKYLSKTVIVALWNLALLRALIPVYFPILKSPFVTGKLTSMGSRDVMIKEMALGISEQLNASHTNSFQIETITEYIWTAWGLGVATVVFFMIWRNRSEIRAMRDIVPMKCKRAEELIEESGIRRNVRVYRGKRFHSPVTSGLLRPKIILPLHFEEETDTNIRNMILHELMHIRRFDVPKRYCMSIASCIHWFNLLMWICYGFYRKDQELACDEGVLRSMNFKDAKEYAATLISMSAKNEREPLFLEGFQKKNAERERILSAIENRKMGIAGSIAAIILIASSVLSFASYMPETNKSPMSVVQNRITKEKEIPRNKIPEEIDQEVDKETERQMSKEEEMRISESEYYQVILDDITENYNDFSIPLTEKQMEALNYMTDMDLAKMFLGRLKQGVRLKEDTMDLIEECYPDRNYMNKK